MESSPMMRAVKPFSLGQIVATPDALQALERTGQDAQKFLAWHASGDWGEVDAKDWKSNDDALKDGGRLLSVYTLKDGKTKIWIVSEAENDVGVRVCSTVLLPPNF